MLRLSSQELTIQLIISSFSPFKVHTLGNPPGIICLQDLQRILPQTQPILILDQLPLVRGNLRCRKMERTLTTNPQSRRPVLEDLDQTVAQREDAIAVRIGR